MVNEQATNAHPTMRSLECGFRELDKLMNLRNAPPQRRASTPTSDRRIYEYALALMEGEMDDPMWPDEDHGAAWTACVADVAAELQAAVEDRWLEYRAGRRRAMVEGVGS